MAKFNLSANYGWAEKSERKQDISLEEKLKDIEKITFIDEV